MSHRLNNLHALLPPLLALSLLAGCVPETPLPNAVWHGSDIVLDVDVRVIENPVPRRATLAGLLDSYEFDGRFVYQFVEAVRPVFDPRRIRGCNTYRLTVDHDGNLRRFEYYIDN